MSNDGHMVWHEPKHVGYFYSCLTAATDSIRKFLQSPEMVAVHGYTDLKVESDYPIVAEAWPYVRVGYVNEDFQPAAPNEWVMMTDKSTGGRVDVAAYVFSGRVTIDVYANSPVEGAILADCIVSGIGIDPKYRQCLRDNPYVNIEPNMATLSNTTNNDSKGTPWDDDLVTVFKQFSFKVRGEFYYIDRVNPTFIEKIKLHLMIDADELDVIITGEKQAEEGMFVEPAI